MVASADVHDRAITNDWGLNEEATNLGIYGSSWVGWVGGVVTPTNVERVLRTGLDVLDHYNNTYPTALYYNPLEEDAVIDVSVEGTKDLYDSVTGEVLVSNA